MQSNSHNISIWEHDMKIIGTLSLLFVLLLGASSIPNHDFASELSSAVKPYRFNIAGWEFKTIAQQIGQHIWGRDKKIEHGTDTVTKYLALGSHINALKAEMDAINRPELQSELNDLEKQRDALGGTVEMIIKQQVQQTLAEQGIYNPWYKYDRLKLDLPPVNLKLETPPRQNCGGNSQSRASQENSLRISSSL
jgi:hypothetical protein